MITNKDSSKGEEIERPGGDITYGVSLIFVWLSLLYLCLLQCSKHSTVYMNIFDMVIMAVEKYKFGESIKN